jgi:LL-diaminopimelate aminotransferase
MFQQADRMAALAPEVFQHMNALQKNARASGVDVIQLGLGNPDLAPALHIIEALKGAADSPNNYGYTGSKGSPELLNAIAGWYGKEFGVKLDPLTEVHSLIGSHDGLAHIALCLVNPGDVVLVPNPGYPIYNAGSLIAGAELYQMRLTPENNYLPDLNSINKDILKRAKLMILNYPNNPLAATAPRAFFEEVVDLAKRYNFVVCHDFAYSNLVFDGYRQDSFLSIPGAKEIGIEFNSLSKTYNMSGCRVGYIVGNPQVISLLGGLKSNFDYGIFAPLQVAAVAALTGPQECIQETIAVYKRRRDIIVDGFNGFGWHVERPKASMYVWAKIPILQSSFDFTIDLFRETGVMVFPGSAFGECGEGFIRIALVQPEDRLIEAVSRIKSWIENLHSFNTAIQTSLPIENI